MRLGSSVSSPVQSGVATTPWTTTSLPSSSMPGRVGAEDHRHPLLGQADALQAEQVVVVERDRLHLDGRPAVGRLGFRPVADLQHGERVLRGGRGDEGGKHDRTLTEQGTAGDTGRAPCDAARDDRRLGRLRRDVRRRGRPRPPGSGGAGRLGGAARRGDARPARADPRPRLWDRVPRRAPGGRPATRSPGSTRRRRCSPSRGPRRRPPGCGSTSPGRTPPTRRSDRRPSTSSSAGTCSGPCPTATPCWRTWARLLRPGGRLVLVEGRWGTGAGLPADECRELVLRHRGEADVRQLAPDPALWGRRVDDERYLLLSTR